MRPALQTCILSKCCPKECSFVMSNLELSIEGVSVVVFNYAGNAARCQGNETMNRNENPREYTGRGVEKPAGCGTRPPATLIDF